MEKKSPADLPRKRGGGEGERGGGKGTKTLKGYLVQIGPLLDVGKKGKGGGGGEKKGKKKKGGFVRIWKGAGVPKGKGGGKREKKKKKRARSANTPRKCPKVCDAKKRRGKREGGGVNTTVPSFKAD